MATEGNGGLGSSEEVREGQLMGPTLESVDASLMEDSTQNRFPWLKPKIDGLVHEAFKHFWKSGPESVATFLKEGSTQNTSTTWLDSKIHTLVREEFEHFMKSGTESDAAFLKEGSTQNTSTTWLDSKIRTLVHEAFEHFLKLGPAREQIQERYGRILRLRFQTSMPRRFFVGENVEGRDFCVKLIDATTATDDVVASGDLSFMTLDVVVLDGDFGKEDHQDWTWEHFECKLEQSRERKGPLLEGDLQVHLKGGVGSLGEFKFTDISTCRRSGKLRLGVKVASGFYQGIRVLEAITAPFEVIHFKKKSKEKHVPRALDDDVCTLMGIGKDGAFHKNLNNAGISKVKDFLWKLGLDPKGLRTIVGKTMSEKNWKTLGDHAKESIPCGKYHVYYADDTKNSGVVFENMSELCGLIEDGKCYSAETLSDNKKVLADNLKKEACAKWKEIVEYDGPPLLEMNPSKRARFSQTDVVNPGQDIGAPVLCQPPSVPSGEASKSSMPDSEGADLIYAMLENVLDLPVLRDPPAQADENSVCSSGLDTFGREDDQSDSHLLPSPLDLPEQANGRNEVWEWGGNGEYYVEDEFQDQDMSRFMMSGHFGVYTAGESSVAEEDSSSDSDNEKSAPSSFKLSCRGKPTERKKNISAAAYVIGGATAIWVLFQLLEYHLTPVCYWLILSLAIYTFINKSPPPIPEINIPEDTVVNIALAIRFEINRAFAVLRKNASGRDFPKFLAGLWVLSIVGTRCSFFTLFYIAFVALHTVRVLYEEYEDQIDSFAEKAMAEFKKQWAVFDARVLSKIPRGTIYNRA